MKRLFSRKEQEIREAFQVYQTAQNQAMGDRRGEGTGFVGNNRGNEDSFVENFQENGGEERIYRLIEKLPIENPRKKARRIWIGSVAVVLLCVLIGCMAHYHADKQARITRALQEVYTASGKRMEAGKSNPLFTEDALVYQCHYLTGEEQKILRKKGVTYRKSEISVAGGYEDCQVYEIADRESHQFILVEDEFQQVCLGKFIGWQNLREGQEASGDSGNRPENEYNNLGEIFEGVMGIHSPDDIRSVTLERSKAVDKNDPERMVAMWTGQEDREWFFRFFEGGHTLWSRHPGEKETQEELRQLREQGMSITYGKGMSGWKPHVLQNMAEQAFYLAIENKLHETYILGLILEQGRAELWMEPLEEWCSQTLAEGGDSLCYTGDMARETVQVSRRNGVILLSADAQKKLWKAMKKELD